jgi:uncharacterized membrane protein
MLFILGLIFTPITRKIFSSFFDFGYPLSKAIAILLLTYGLFLLSTLHIVRFDMLGIGIVLAIAVYINYRFHKKFPQEHTQRQLTFVILEEALFLVAFLSWVYIRSHQSDIRGLEKFMDFGFMNSVMRGPYLPAHDMWLAGKSINYYYFGHISGAFLTKLSQIPGNVAYNLILATIFALGITETFSLGFNIAYRALKKNLRQSLLTGILASFLVNLAGNLHTIYAFTKGYDPEKAVPFWQLSAKYSLAEFFNPKILLSKLSDFYWYPNATRFIPFTIHEFPIYSYVVAGLHGHVFDIPFVLLTLGVLYVFFMEHTIATKFDLRLLFTKLKNQHINYIWPVILGFLISVHYMTNAFDALIYLLLTGIIFLIVFSFSRNLLINLAILIVSFIIFSVPFNIHFEPFSSSIGLNCAPAALVKLGKLGPFIFEQDKCQISPWWMLLTLWGFFWFNFISFSIYKLRSKREVSQTELFLFILFFTGTILIIIPEFIYAKDIYPSHFRANTMFKLGYQAFMMMGLACAYVFTAIKHNIDKEAIFHKIFIALWIPLFILVGIYPNFAINSFYANQVKKPTLDGSTWMISDYPEYKEVIDFLNITKVADNTVILEAQGDSYTDYDIVSAYTGMPTIAGWYVHQWLWRGNPDVVGKVIPSIETIYKSHDTNETMQLLKKLHISYVIIGPNEQARYTGLYEDKFEALGQLIFESSNKKARVYKIPLDSI